MQRTSHSVVELVLVGLVVSMVLTISVAGLG
jgi:hypothetical protein